MTTEAKRTEESLDVGRRYRYDHLQLRLVLRDMYFSRDDPGPGDRVPDFDLPTLGGGRFRSRDLDESGPALRMASSSENVETSIAIGERPCDRAAFWVGSISVALSTPAPEVSSG